MLARCRCHRTEPPAKNLDRPKVNASTRPPRIAPSIGMSSHRIDDGRHFGDLGYRETSQLGVFANQEFAFGKVDAKGPVSSDERLHPLHFPGKLSDCTVGRRSKFLELRAAPAPDIPYVAFDQIALHCFQHDPVAQSAITTSRPPVDGCGA